MAGLLREATRNPGCAFARARCLCQLLWLNSYQHTERLHLL